MSRTPVLAFRRALLVSSRLGLVFAALSSAPCRAGGESPDPFAMSPEQLFAATVVSTRTANSWWDTPAAVFVLTNQDIARSGATSIPEALRLVPGVNVARVNNSTWAVSARGFNGTIANKLLVLMDGREVYNSLFSGVYWDVQDTALEDIERIEVIRGPGGALWGSNAVNGVINIITRSASDTQGALVSALGGNEEAIATLRHGGEAPAKGHYRVFGKALRRDDQAALGSGSGEDEWVAGRGGFRADWKDESKRSALTFQGDGYYSQADNFRSVPLLTAPFNITEEQAVVATGGNVLGRFSHRLEGGSRFSLQSYVDYTNRNLDLLEEEFVAADLDAQYELSPWSFLGLVVGGRYRYSYDELDGSPQVRFRHSGRSDDRYSGFAQGQLALVPDSLFLTLGTKLEQNDYSGLEVQPSGRLQWHPDDRNTVWASVARAVRRPSRLEHDVDLDLATLPPSAASSDPTLVRLQSNRDFDSEELLAYEIGYRSRWHPALLFDVAGFYNDYDRLATATILPTFVVDNGSDPVHVVLPITITNDTGGYGYGGEAAATWRVVAPLQLSVGYSYLKIVLDGPPSNVAIAAEAAEEQSPRHQVTLRSQWDVTDDVSLDAIVYYVDALPAFDLGDQWRFDVRIGWEIWNGLDVDVVGQNLLEDEHREFSSRTSINTTAVQRAAYLRVRWRF